MSRELTPIKAIRAKCVDCCGGQTLEVRLCEITTCTLHPYRMGKRPTPKGVSKPKKKKLELEVAESYQNTFEDMEEI